MKPLEIAIVGGLLAFGAVHFHVAVTKMGRDPFSQTAAAAGFVAVPMPDGAIANQVLVVGPNCTTPRGVRTRALTTALAKANIPYQRTEHLQFSDPDDLTAMGRLDQVMAGDAPIVFVHGQAKANPTPEVVMQIYKAR